MKNISLWFKRACLVLALVGTAMTVAGCRNTAHGVGQDMENAGEEIQERTD